jgi:hypothetical protein
MHVCRTLAQTKASPSLTSPSDLWLASVLNAPVAKHPQARRPGCMEQRHEPSGAAGVCCWQHCHQVHQGQCHGVTKGTGQLRQLREAFGCALGLGQ